MTIDYYLFQPIPDTNVYLVQTTDYFYPLINDPYKMGWIACNNVISDLYAMGVERIGPHSHLIAVSVVVYGSSVVVNCERDAV